MNLHRSTGRPDWDTIPAKDRNWAQKIAFQTRGLVTPPNVITLFGFGLIIAGLVSIAQASYWWGLSLLVAGRLADIADGWLAHATGTKSPLGETLDVVVDKLGLLLTVIVLYVSKTAPLWALAALILPQFTISLITAYRVYHKSPIHPSRIGKLSMLVAGLSFFGLIFLKAASVTTNSVGYLLVYGLVVLSASMAVFAAIGYLMQKD